MKYHIKQVTDKVTIPYSIYVMFFLGIGLLSGSLVHFPLDPQRYSLIAGFGALLFLIGAYFNEKIINKTDMLEQGFGKLMLFLVSSLALAIGIGMIAGGTQHFSDFPSYAMKLIPIGILLSVISYVLKNRISLEKKEVYILSGKTVAVILAIIPLLSFYASSITTETENHNEVESHAEEAVGHH